MWVVEALNQLNHCALATPTWTNQSHCLTFVDLKVNTIQYLVMLEEPLVNVCRAEIVMVLT